MNIPVLNIWDETQKKYVGIPAITSGDTGGVNEDMLDDAINDAINNALTDVSSQIKAHNENSVAHSSVRASALAAARAYTDAEIAKIGDSIPEPLPKPLTRDYMPEGYPYIDPVGDRMFIYSGDYDGTKVSTTKASGIIEYSDAAEELITGQSYVVTFNDVDYVCVCYEVTANKLKCLGNYKIHSTNAEDTGEPFFLMESARKRSLYVMTPIDNTDPFTLAINKAIPVAVPMDEKFLPESVKCANAPVVEELSESATVLVEDGGEVKRVAKDKVGGGSIPNPIPYDYMPEGYPKKEVGTITVDNSETLLDESELPLEGFPAFAVGDTVTVTIDGVEQSLVAYDFDGIPIIGASFADLEGGGGAFDWGIACFGEVCVFLSMAAHTVSYKNIIAVPMSPEFLPSDYLKEASAAVNPDDFFAYPLLKTPAIIGGCSNYDELPTRVQNSKLNWPQPTVEVFEHYRNALANGATLLPSKMYLLCSAYATDDSINGSYLMEKEFGVATSLENSGYQAVSIEKYWFKMCVENGEVVAYMGRCPLAQGPYASAWSNPVIMLSPNGTKYELTVADDGTLTTKVAT